ncbi:MAG: ATP synthase subunit b, sodium ion specific [Candidatus Nomurabacteria bacterium GW2011_GWA1_37_20]|uniref:ATP synthase subunit b, sodium ion specific n=2 Tax=Parcubacteria group TaxID=1794811 RepID=A0A0G0HXK2_9BACT|nr:MAG: ATP synthase subunit b, sodium ion specific [Parcubacteria group bacterium GW2011_GWC1_36_9]KKQ27183.1 MAG: ATP synthase subunit b, sodium ion specific [Parcubacteria group bacterium GW2011_GWB1_37_13]KKQ33714.1 MAG: ATP synthase subunit b, sodium ion specific [Candidatus Nomurabacteria bacterium GW2011_GWA1_37_20]KKQ47868.1 MAG: ATP synthase subunit b, sodium ion specific [Candidatus Yanofskybacteria bacterium GW2011_GWC2_37_9]
MQEFITTFHIDWKLMVAQLFNFGVVFLAFYLLAAKPLRKLMKERGEVISKGLNDSKKATELLQKAAVEYKENTIKLRKISADAQKELGEDLKKLRAENLERIKIDNDEWTKKRIMQMELDKKTLLESAKNELASLAILAAEKIMAEKNK